MVTLQVTSDQQDALPLIQSAIAAKIKRIEIGLRKTEQEIQRFEAKYRISSDQFLDGYTADDLEGGDTLAASPLKIKLLKLCEKKAGFLPAYDFPTCLRTSTMVDRLMRGMDKYLFAKQYFHGTLVSTEYGIRAYCLLSNFRPSIYNSVNNLPHHTTIRSPFTELNGFAYHECWLQNMLIATSRQEMYRFQQKQLV
jgi:hypothetical protein